jgi:hypothetical protein
MSLEKMLAIGLLVVGALGLAYGGFSYTRDTHEANLGPLNVTVEDNDYVNVPVWASFGALLVGAVLLLRRKR